MNQRWMVTMGLLALAGGALGGLSYSLTAGGAFAPISSGEEELEFQGGAENRKFTMVRNVLDVPPDFGRLVGATSSGGDAALWFEAQDGTVRNVVVAGRALVRLQRRGRLISAK